MSEKQIVQTFGKKKNAIAVATFRKGTGMIRVNGKPIQQIEPSSLKIKVYEPILLVGGQRFSTLNIRVRVTGGGQTNQIFAIRQAIAKGIVAWAQKYEDETTKRELKETFLQYDRNLLVADQRRCEPKKYGGPGARARYQKSYR